MQRMLLALSDEKVRLAQQAFELLEGYGGERDESCSIITRVGRSAYRGQLP